MDALKGVLKEAPDGAPDEDDFDHLLSGWRANRGYLNGGAKLSFFVEYPRPVLNWIRDCLAAGILNDLTAHVLSEMTELADDLLLRSDRKSPKNSLYLMSVRQLTKENGQLAKTALLSGHPESERIGWALLDRQAKITLFREEWSKKDQANHRRYPMSILLDVLNAKKLESGDAASLEWANDCVDKIKSLMTERPDGWSGVDIMKRVLDAAWRNVGVDFLLDPKNTDLGEWMGDWWCERYPAETLSAEHRTALLELVPFLDESQKKRIGTRFAELRGCDGFREILDRQELLAAVSSESREAAVVKAGAKLI